ncbi:MAG TPA: hypothetical protein VMJ10_28115 [Kofleriaceae bacterium]|nr:hypothetical protein [Kofleriaceae bacterium]
MILISGNDPIVDGLCSALDSLGRPYRRVDNLDAGHAWELHATTVMVVESLPRVTATASASERGLRELISAANAPGVRSAIIVTPRPDADAELRAVRRSGIPYTILRPLPIVERASDPDKPVLVTRELAGAPAAAVTTDMIVDAVVGVIDGNACGQTLDIAPPAEMTWRELLARAGVTPKPVARWRARVGRWFGARTFDTSVASVVSAPV